MKDECKPVIHDHNFHYTKVTFTEFKDGRIALYFSSSKHHLKNEVILDDLDRLKNIRDMLGDIIREIEDDHAS